MKLCESESDVKMKWKSDKQHEVINIYEVKKWYEVINN